MWCMFQERKAVVTLYKENEVVGQVDFVQEQVDGSVKVSGRVNLTQGTHGFHIHERGDIRNSCATVGDHFNPENVCNL